MSSLKTDVLSAALVKLHVPDQAITVDLPENWWMSDDNDLNFNPNFAKGKK